VSAVEAFFKGTVTAFLHHFG